MKKLIALAVLLSALAAQGQAEGSHFYAGGGLFPLEFKDFQNIAVSDWQTYGTGPAEGRIRLPLGDAKASGMVPCFVIGVDHEFIPRVKGLLEVQGAIATGAYPTVINVGAGWAAVKNEKFSLSIVPKIGYAVGSIDFGQAKVIPGKLAPVILPEGTIRNGVSLTASISGVAYQGGVNAMYMFNERIGLSLDVAYIYSALSDFELKAGDIKISRTSPAVVKDDGGTTQAGIDPRASISGAVANLSLVIGF